MENTVFIFRDDFFVKEQLLTFLNDQQLNQNQYIFYQFDAQNDFLIQNNVLNLIKTVNPFFINLIWIKNAYFIFFDPTTPIRRWNRPNNFSEFEKTLSVVLKNNWDFWQDLNYSTKKATHKNHNIVIFSCALQPNDLKKIDSYGAKSFDLANNWKLMPDFNDNLLLTAKIDQSLTINLQNNFNKLKMMDWAKQFVIRVELYKPKIRYNQTHLPADVATNKYINFVDSWIKRLANYDNTSIRSNITVKISELMRHLFANNKIGFENLAWDAYKLFVIQNNIAIDLTPANLQWHQIQRQLLAHDYEQTEQYFAFINQILSYEANNVQISQTLREMLTQNYNHSYWESLIAILLKHSTNFLNVLIFFKSNNFSVLKNYCQQFPDLNQAKNSKATPSYQAKNLFMVASDEKWLLNEINAAGIILQNPRFCLEMIIRNFWKKYLLIEFYNFEAQQENIIQLFKAYLNKIYTLWTELSYCTHLQLTVNIPYSARCLIQILILRLNISGNKKNFLTQQINQLLTIL